MGYHFKLKTPHDSWGADAPDLFQAHKHMDRRGLRVKSQEVTKKSIGSNPMKGEGQEGQGRPGKAREGQGRPGKAREGHATLWIVPPNRRHRGSVD